MNYSSAAYVHTVKNLKALAGELCNNRLAVFGGGGYSLETCALRWTQVAAELADFALPDRLPVSWRESYQKTTHEEAVVSFEEAFTTDNTTARVEKMVDWFIDKVNL